MLKLRYSPKNIHAPEYLDIEASDHPKVNKYQDAVATDDTEVPEDLDADSSFLPEVPEYQEVLGAGAREEGNTQKTSDYNTTINLDIANIDKN